MTEQTITFTPMADLRKGLRSVASGSWLVLKSVARLYDGSLHRHPYPHLAAILIAALVASFVSIAGARSERDAATRKNFQLQQRLDSITNEIEARGGDL